MALNLDDIMTAGGILKITNNGVDAVMGTLAPNANLIIGFLAGGTLVLKNIPTADPHVEGAIWKQMGTDNLKVSDG